jgi:tol-pal system protein YbgF
MAASLTGAAIFITALGVSTPASALFSDDEARRAILDLRAKVEALTVRVTELEQQLQSANQGRLQLLNESEQLRADLARLRGKVEETAQVATTGRSQQKDLYGDLDQRLRSLEPTEIDIDGVRYRVSPLEKERFDAIRDLIRKGDFKGAVSAANTFQQAFPVSSIAAYVLLDKGTALYADKNYKASIATRQEFIKKYPDHPARPQATLNLAASQAESGNPNTARGILQGLIKNYPSSPAAAEARERLKALQKPAPSKPASTKPAPR